MLETNRYRLMRISVRYFSYILYQYITYCNIMFKHSVTQKYYVERMYNGMFYHSCMLQIVGIWLCTYGTAVCGRTVASCPEILK